MRGLRRSARLAHVCYSKRHTCGCLLSVTTRACIHVRITCHVTVIELLEQAQHAASCYSAQYVLTKWDALYVQRNTRLLCLNACTFIASKHCAALLQILEKLQYHCA